MLEILSLCTVVGAVHSDYFQTSPQITPYMRQVASRCEVAMPETFSDKNMSTRVHFFICSSKSSSFFHSPMLQRRREPGVFNVDGHTQTMWGAVADPSPANTPLEAINMDIKTLQRSHWRKWHETHINVALNTDQEEGEGRGGQNIKGRSRKINEPEVKENSQK